ncbi:MAG: hypothetical protein QXV79_03110 [Thermofilaceae archaeon]
MKSGDWLKPVADRLLRRVAEGEFSAVYAFRESLYKMYYVSPGRAYPSTRPSPGSRFKPAEGTSHLDLGSARSGKRC